MLKDTKLANTWPWNKEWIAFAFWVPGLSGLLLMYLTKPALGNSAYWLLGLSVWGIFFSLLYGYVANKVRAKLNLLRSRQLEPFDGLVSFGKFQAPAAIAISKDKLYIAAIVGPEIIYNLSDIKSYSQQSFLPNKRLIFKRAFHLEFKDKPIIAFAVNQNIAGSIEPIFNNLSKHR